MLFLLFHLGADRYALDTRQVVEVLPVVSHKRIPHAAPGVAGAFVYHGTPVPLIDLVQLTLGVPAPRLMSSRIVVVNYSEDDAKSHHLGLLAEKATETLACAPDDFVDPGVAVDAAPYLGPVLMDPRGMIQRIEINRLLPADVCEQLFRTPLDLV